MKKHINFKISVFLIFMFCNIAFVTGQEKKETILLERINIFNQAFKECNITVLESMITDNYLHTNGSSKSIDKSAWISYLHKRKKEIEIGNLVINDYEMKDIKMQLYNNAAVVTAKIITVNTSNGELKKNEFRVTNIWIYEDNHWKRAAFHDGKIK